MKNTLFFLFFLPQLLFSQQAAKVAPLVIGETITFTSAILEEERTLNIYLPAYYQYDSLKNYPVIYLLDGGMDEDFMHMAGLVQFCSFSWINDLPESIVVGISNVDRKRDFTFPTSNAQDKLDFPTSGGSESFINFLKYEVPLHINKRYRTNDTTTLIGQSLGGLLATEILLKQPEVFDNYIIISPSLWWDDQSLLGLPLPGKAYRQGIFIGVGKEGEIMERDAKALHTKLQGRTDELSKLFFQFFPNRDHGDTLHEAAYAAFQRLFAAENR